MVRYQNVVSLYIVGKSRTETYANDALGANQLDQLIGDGSLSIALAVSLEVAQVTDVALLVAGGTVGLVVGVDYLYICLSMQRSHVGTGRAPQNSQWDPADVQPFVLSPKA